MAIDPGTILARMLKKPTLNIARDRSYEESFARIVEAYDKAKMYKGNELDDTYTSLVSLLQSVDTKEGMDVYAKNLNKFTSDSLKFGGFDDNIIQSDTLKFIGKQKRDMMEAFETNIQAGSDFINTTQFLDTADEFKNIQNTIDIKNKELRKEGKTPHESVADFLQSEISNANSIKDNIASGFIIDKDGNITNQTMKYNSAESNDKDVYRKISKYLDRLQLATLSLAGDKIISSDEAEAILIGDKENYINTKRVALTKAEDNYKYNRGKVVEYDKLINSAKQKRLSAEDVFSMKDDMSSADFMDVANSYDTSDWSSIMGHLNDTKGNFIEARNQANINFKNWYGDYFQEVKGGMTLDDAGGYTKGLIESKEDVKKQIEKKMGFYPVDKDVTPEQKAETKKKKRQFLGVLPREMPEDKELYSSSEKILEDYIKGDLSIDSLKQIGGQSLINKANRIKDRYKGEYAGKKLYKGKPVSSIDTLKELKYGAPGDRYSWHDVTNIIYKKKGRGLSVIDDYLSDNIGITDLKLTYRKRRDRAEAIKQQFKNLGISLGEFKEKYSKDYRTLVNLLGKSKAK